VTVLGNTTYYSRQNITGYPENGPQGSAGRNFGATLILSGGIFDFFGMGQRPWVILETKAVIPFNLTLF